MKKIFFLILLSIQFVFCANYSFKIIEQTPSYLHLKIKFDTPELTKEDNGITARYDQAVFTLDNNNNYLPAIVKFFNLSVSATPSVSVISVQTGQKQVKRYSFSNDPNLKGQNLNSWVQVKYLGEMGQMPVLALTIFPVKVSANHQNLTYLKSLEVAIGKKTGGSLKKTYGMAEPSRIDKTLTKALLLNSSNQIYASPSAEKATIAAAQTPVQKYEDWQSVLQNDIVFKLKVKEDGIYKVTYDELVQAGFPVEKIDPTHLSLYNKGREIPIYIQGEKDFSFDENDYIEFWGEKNQKTFYDEYPELYSDPFSDTNVYWLVYTQRKGLRLLEESGGITTSRNQLVISPFAFKDTLHFEQNNSSQKFGHTLSLVNRPAYEIDQYYYDTGVSAPGSIGYDFYLPHPADFGADVTVWGMLRGKSYYGAANNPLRGHQVAIKLRGKGNVARLVGQVMPEDGWKDQYKWMITNADSAVKIDQSILNDGTNRLEVDMFQSGVTDIVLLNWFNISYLHLYKADHDYLKFHVDRDFFDGRYVKLGDKIQFNVDGFTKDKIDVYKLGISKIMNVEVKPVTDEKTKEFSYGLSFQDEIVDPAVQYVALTDDQKKKVLSIEAYRPWQEEDPQKSLLDASNTADYLIITHDLLSKECQQLKSFKEAQGYHVQIVTVRDIYDLFNYGIKSPLAIKDFIRYAYEHWDASTPLEYVVLVGDAAGNYRSNADLVPTIYYQTLKYGAAESDYQYALLEGDDYIPEVVVSRIPAGSVYDLKNYLDKLENYSSEASGDWVNRTLFLSGYDGTKEYLTNKPVFRTQSLRLIHYRLPAGFFAEQINSIKNANRNPDPHFGNSRDVIDYFDQGLSYVNFVGHGGGAIWADAGLMGLQEAEQLNNGYKLPFISSMTCFTGSFGNVGRSSLGEALLLGEKKGAIAFLGSSGVGWIYNDYAIEWGLFDYLWNPDLTIGQAVYLMKIFYLANPFYYTEDGRFYTFGYGTIRHSQVSQYNLFGDPAIHIVQPKATLDVEVDKPSALPGDQVNITINNLPTDAQVQLEVTDEENYKVYKTQTQASADQVTIPFVVPDDMADQTLRVKVFAPGPDNNAHGEVKIAVGQPLIHTIRTLPANPQVMDSITFKISVFSGDDPVEAMSIINLTDAEGYQNYAQVIPLKKMNDSLFQSIEPFPGFSTGGKKIFDVRMQTKSGQIVIEHRKQLEVKDPRPDILIVPGSITWGGQSNLQLLFKVKNNSNVKVNSVVLACYDDKVKQDQPFTTKSIDLNGNEEKQIRITMPPDLKYTPYHQIKIVADPDSLIEERNEVNNILQTNLFLNYLTVSPQVGTSLDEQTHQKVALADSWQLEIPVSGVPEKTLFKFISQNINEQFSKAHQYDLRYIPLTANGDSTGLKLEFMNSNVENKVNGDLSVTLDTVQLKGLNRERMSIYRYDPTANAWMAQKSQWVAFNTLSAKITGSGLFAVFYSKDNQQPMLEITVNGRPLLSGMLVPRQPTMGILLQDANGVDLHHTVNLKIDNTDYIKDGIVANDAVSFPENAHSIKNIQITLSPDLKSGQHKLIVQAADVNGNLAEKELAFSVTQDFNIIVYGNYPNPFKDKTIISYTIESNEPIDNLSIKIYTTSGRLVRSKMLDLDETVPDDDILEPNYHELVWDGTDDDGNPVANGVYFAVIKGKYRNKVVKRLLKMARLQ